MSTSVCPSSSSPLSHPITPCAKGRLSTAAADCMSGTRASPVTSSSTTRWRAARVEYRAWSSRLMSSVSTFSGSNPRSSAANFMKLCAASALATSRVSVIATCTTTRTRRVSERIPRPASRIESAFIELITADRFDCIAGTRATPRVTAAVISRHATRTTASTRVSDKRATVAGLTAISVRRAAAANAMPTIPPAAARTPASTRLCLTSCHGVAPSARRTASSRERSALRAARRPATFAHAMTSTRPTAPMTATTRDARFQTRDRGEVERRRVLSICRRVHNLPAARRLHFGRAASTRQA